MSDAASLLDKQLARGQQRLRDALPHLTPLAKKVARVHGGHQPHLVAVSQGVEALGELLASHLEEIPADPGALEVEHRDLSRELKRLRSTAQGHEVPQWACNSYRALFGGLVALEADLLQQLDLEKQALATKG